MRPLIRHALMLSCAAALLLVPRAASAITIDQVIALAKSGVTDTVILALIDRDRTVFAIEPERIVALQRDGLSERVILAMLKSGRDERIKRRAPSRRPPRPGSWRTWRPSRSR